MKALVTIWLLTCIFCKPFLYNPEIFEPPKEIIGVRDYSQLQDPINLGDGTKLINIKCLYVNKFRVFTLQSLQKEEGDYKKSINNGTLFFNFCQDTNEKINGSQSVSTMFYKKGNKITRLSGTIDPNENSNDKNSWELIESNDEIKGVKISYTMGDKCESGTGNHQTILKVLCNSTKTDFKEDDLDLKEFDINGCKHTLTFYSSTGCKVNGFHLLNQLIDEYKILFTILFCIIGLFLCFSGAKRFKITAIIISGIACSVIFSVIFLGIGSKIINTEKKLWILLGVTFVAGLVIGAILIKCLKVIVFLLGATLGYMLGNFVYQIIQQFVNFNPEVMYYVVIGLCAVICGVIGLWFLKVIVVLSTSIFGAYLFAQGLSFVIGHWPDIQVIIDLLKNREFEQLKQTRDAWLFGYLGGWALLSVIGIFVQFHRNKSRKDEDYKRHD